MKVACGDLKEEVIFRQRRQVGCLEVKKVKNKEVSTTLRGTKATKIKQIT